MLVNLMNGLSWRFRKNNFLALCLLVSVTLVLPLSGMGLEILPDEVVAPENCRNQEPDFLNRLKHNQRYSLLCYIPAADWQVFRDDIIDNDSLKVEAEQLVEKISNNDFILPALTVVNSELKRDDAELEKMFDLMVYIHIHLADQLTTDNLLNVWITQLLPAAQFGSASISRLDSVDDGSFQGVEVALDEHYQKAFPDSGRLVNKCPHTGSQKPAEVLTWIRILDKNLTPFSYDRKTNRVKIPVMAQVWADIAEYNRKHFSRNIVGQPPEQPVLFLGATDIKALYKLRKNRQHPVALYHPKLSEPFLTPDHCYAGPAMAAWHDIGHILLLSSIPDNTKQQSYEFYNALTQLGQDLQTGTPSSPTNAFFLAHYSEVMDRLARRIELSEGPASQFLTGLFEYKAFFEGQSVNINDSTYFELLDIGNARTVVSDDPQSAGKLLDRMLGADTELEEAYWGLAYHYYVFTHMDKLAESGESIMDDFFLGTLGQVWREVMQ
ncbi:hypothetical protein [Endozoicomonas sp. 4G]|uniref:hypothetical protein n=1 Tax=Endozoicomonas sp. 4G TaxID=2872754 RepID=UPI0020789204|nr:hypothetical protein [Endozoicomonas sp. 4G]